MDQIAPTSRAGEWDDSKENRAVSPTRRRKVKGCLIAQFASNKGEQLADAAELIKPWVDGVDINCGESSAQVFNDSH